MQTDPTGYELVLDPAAYKGIKLVETDGMPMDTIWHRDAMVFLIALTRANFGDRDDYFVGGNNFLYFNPQQARNRDYRGPDYFFVKDRVDGRRPRQFWAVWQEQGRLPDVILELLSPTTAQEDRTTKFTIYEQTLRTPEYFLYDAEAHLLEGHRLIGQSYVRLQPNDHGWLWSAELELWIGEWFGSFQGGVEATWLRLYTPDGQLVLLPEERERQRAEREHQRAEQERQEKEREHQRAEQERQRAEQECQRAERAEQELARLKASLQQQTPPKNGASGA